MSARNIYHDCVIRVLERDGWTITHDPLQLKYGGERLFVDIGAQQLPLGAEKLGRKIAVEVQSFVGHSPMNDLEKALGQFARYRLVLAKNEPERVLYLAVPTRVDDNLLSREMSQLLLSKLDLKVLVFNEETEEVVRWIN